MSNLKNVATQELVSDYFHSRNEIMLLRGNPCPTKADEQYRDRQIRKTEAYMVSITDEMEKRGLLERLLV